MGWSGGRATPTRLALSAALFCIGQGGGASAAEPDGSNLSRAHDAYARGAAAYAQGDYERAARDLAAADLLVPDAVTLKAALDAVTLADDPVLGVELIARSSRAALDAALSHSVSLARARFAHRTGRVVVRCGGCLAMVDGAAVPPGVPRVVLPGVHLVTVQVSGPPEPRMVTVAADETREVPGDSQASPPPGPPDAPPPSRAPAGLSPAWFVVAASATVALGAVTAWSAVDTAKDHQSFESAGCDVTSSRACPGLASVGQGAQTRTLGLGVGTGVAAAGTVALAVLGVRWPRGGGAGATVGLAGSTVVARVTF